jgi:hypothetical protein
MGALSSLATLGLNLALAQQASKQQSGSVKAERDRQIAAIRQRDQQQQREQADLLRRRLAAQRARAGASGVGGSGSAGAVLRGLVEEATAEDQARAATSSRRIAGIRRSASQQRRNNLLDLAGGVGTSAASLVGSGSGRLFSLLDR